MCACYNSVRVSFRREKRLHTNRSVSMHISMVFQCFSNWWGDFRVLSLFMLFFMPHCALVRAHPQKIHPLRLRRIGTVAAASVVVVVDVAVAPTVSCQFSCARVHFRCILTTTSTRRHACQHTYIQALGSLFFGRKSANASDGFHSYYADVERTAVKQAYSPCWSQLFSSFDIHLSLALQLNQRKISSRKNLVSIIHIQCMHRTTGERSVKKEEERNKELYIEKIERKVYVFSSLVVFFFIFIWTDFFHSRFLSVSVSETG